MAKTEKAEPKIILVGNTKGGVGKSTIAQHVAPFLLGSSKVRILEADTHNESWIAVEDSKRVVFSSFKVRGKGIDDVTDEAMISTLADELNTVIDAGAGDDTIETVLAVSKNFKSFEVFIPLDPSFENLKNAIDTAKAVPSHIRKVLVFQNFNHISEFWAIFGNDEFGVERNLEFLEYFDETMEIPRSSLFGFAKLYRTTLLDLADIHQTYDFESVKSEWARMPRDDFRARMSRHRLSIAAFELLSSVKTSRKAVSSWI